MRPKNQTGQAIVEFALVLPLLLILIFGVMEFGILLYDKAVITNASREAARYGIVLRNPNYTKAQIEAYAEAYCLNNLISFGGSTNATANATVPASPSFGDQLTVQVSFTYTYLALPKFAAPLGGTIQLNSVSVMTYE